jgi:hypothetical protein
MILLRTLTIMAGLLFALWLPTVSHAHTQDGTGMWYFTGSTYNAKTSPPDPEHRADPISIIWSGPTGAAVTTTSVISHVSNEWQARLIPTWAYGAQAMTERQVNVGCRSAQYVFMRDTSVNSGRWASSSAYMSSNPRCFNQYHSRMWSSAVHADLTCVACEDEWVLAGMHHERWGTANCRPYASPFPPQIGIRCDKPTHHINMSWDQARRVYMIEMNRLHCTESQWAINPESENYLYGEYQYSGIISRVSMRHKTNGCSGA